MILANEEKLSSQFPEAHFEHNPKPEFGPFSSLQIAQQLLLTM